LTSLTDVKDIELEVVLADNASGDGSLELVRRRFPSVTVVPLDENRGFAAANNRAADRASGQQLLLLNTDAWLDEGALAALQQRLGADPKLGLVAPRLLSPDGRPQLGWSPDRSIVGEMLQRITNRWEGARWFHAVLLPMLRWMLGPGWYTGACLLVRTEAFTQVGGFDEGYFLHFEDADLCLRLRQAGWRLGHAADARVFHARGGSSCDAAMLEREYRRSQLRYYATHRPGWEHRLLRRYLARKYPRGPVADMLRQQGTTPQCQ